MTNLFRISTLICVFLILSCYGCASRPDEQLKLAGEAMKQAADMYADQYAPGEWKGAKELWDQAQDQLAKQQYAAAAENLLRAKTRFLKAKDVAQTERESMLKQVKDIQANIQDRYAAFKANANPARKKEFQAACADIDKRVEIVNSLTTQGDYIQAKTLGQQALQAIAYSEKQLKK
jgi:hypothetical protein